MDKSSNVAPLSPEEIQQVIADLSNINVREPAAAKSFAMVIHHVKETYSDKYDKGLEFIDTKKQLYRFIS